MPTERLRLYSEHLEDGIYKLCPQKHTSYLSQDRNLFSETKEPNSVVKSIIRILVDSKIYFPLI